MTQSNAMTMPAPERPLTIDQMHLERKIFARQTMLMLERIAGADPARAAAAAHTLKGSARGIGAWRVAQAAERLEEVAAGEGNEAAMSAAIADLEAASFEARVAIGLRLGDGGEQPAARTLCSRVRDH